MRSVCFYFQVHQPFRLRTYRFFDMGVDSYYYDEFNNRTILRRIAEKSYLPTNKLMLKLIKKHGKDFNIAFSISGLAIEQFEKYAPEVIESFQALAKTGNVEFLAETYSHSLASLKSEEEFSRQVRKHSEKIEELFGQKPVTFRNTELIYSDAIGEMVAALGFKTMLTEGAKHVLGWKSPNYLYHHVSNPNLKLLLKNYRLSDDIAFRFSDQSWDGWPLTADNFVKWLNNLDTKEEVINLFMDYETFGEHQWAETGIFKFMETLPGKVLKGTNFTFNKPSDIAKKLKPVSAIQVPNPISWADAERDLTAWLGNEMQDEAFEKLYEVEQKMKGCDDKKLLGDWDKLQASDHFYYLCTKWFSDGDVHRYFNPYPSPYQAFINYMNVLSDFLNRVDEACGSSDNKSYSDKAREFAEASSKKVKKEAQKAKTKVQDKWDDVKDYSLDDLAKMSNAKVKELISKVNINELAHVMKDASDEVRNKVIPNMTKSVKAQYDKVEQNLKKVKKEDLKKFTLKIEKELKDLWKK
ncbi:MAG: polysaccharide deacetylase family protein [Bacteroidales bacterium]|nr:polysaccharide deacetylase family protein [Bacteroidales bacterium]MCF8404340.1 polysaccharide deacetylase family protein [Bacteroidales bacterium]